jgi:hypothetical protein
MSNSSARFTIIYVLLDIYIIFLHIHSARIHVVLNSGLRLQARFLPVSLACPLSVSISILSTALKRAAATTRHFSQVRRANQRPTEMELKKSPASSSSPPPPTGFRSDSAAASPYVTAPSSPRGRLVPSEGAAAALFLTAPPSPSPFGLLPPATPTRLTGADPFDLFQHFTSAPASPRRAAAIYAHVAEGSGSDDQEFQPRRRLYAATGGSSVPFDWEERPGTPKRGLGGGVPAADVAAWDTGFEFGTRVGNAAPAETLTAADELFEKGKIRPLKPRPKKTADDEPKIRPLKPPPSGGPNISRAQDKVLNRGPSNYF